MHNCYFISVWAEKNEPFYVLRGIENIGLERLQVLFTVLRSQALLLNVVRDLSTNYCQASA